MWRVNAILLILFVCTFVLVAQTDRQLTQKSAGSQSDKRAALVIGNGAYTTAPPLKNPTNDAFEMAATLKTLGFEVTSGVNTNQREMKRLIREFGQKLKAGGSGLFYYAGHGVQSKGRNYLIPIDADIQSEADVEDTSVDLSLVLNYMDEAANGLNIVILDACRNNPFAKSFRSASSGLAQVDAPTGTLIAYATAPGSVASDGSERNGLYTSELLKQMSIPGVSVTDVFMRVRGEVMRKTDKRQVPWEASSLTGSFFFSDSQRPAATPVTETAKISGSESSAFELAYWDTVKNSTIVEDFRAYLKKYPNGNFTELAANRITALESAADGRKKLEDDSGRSTDVATKPVDKVKDAVSDLPVKKEEGVEAKTFKGDLGFRAFVTYLSKSKGTLTVSPSRIFFTCTEDNKDCKTGQEWLQLTCSSFSKSFVDKQTLREIKIGNFAYRFNAHQLPDAAAALAAIKTVCKGK